MGRKSNKETWNERRKSLYVKELMEHAGFTPAIAADYLGISENYFNCKLHRNCWSVGELQLLTYASGFQLWAVDKNGLLWKSLSLEDWYPTDAEQVDMIRKRYDDEQIKQKREEYETLKQTLATMKETYGFEDRKENKT